MSQVHQEWKEQQAEPAGWQNNGFWLHAPRNEREAHAAIEAPITGREPARRWPRTTDEAFKTPAWRNPVQGPYRRAPSAWRPLLACAALVLLIVAGPLLWRLLPALGGLS